MAPLAATPSLVRRGPGTPRAGLNLPRAAGLPVVWGMARGGTSTRNRLGLPASGVRRPAASPAAADGIHRPTRGGPNRPPPWLRRGAFSGHELAAPRATPTRCADRQLRCTGVPSTRILRMPGAHRQRFAWATRQRWRSHDGVGPGGPVAATSVVVAPRSHQPACPSGLVVGWPPHAGQVLRRATSVARTSSRTGRCRPRGRRRRYSAGTRRRTAWSSPASDPSSAPDGN
jgi:hypothetical protein